jgi:steroid 5-alpha reductase family enzyme
MWIGIVVARRIATVTGLTRRGRLLPAIWPALVGALAVLYASLGDGAWTRRSAIGWMMGSWGARLTLQSVYAESAGLPQISTQFSSPLAALFFSVPALFAARNPDPSLSLLEIAAAALWMAAFAGETTADRQFLRFAATTENAGHACRSGIWRVVPHAHAVFEALIWVALALFACASPWGWIALACPATMLSVLVAQRPRHALNL